MNSSTPKDLARLVQAHGPFMERLAAALTATSADAEDLLHDTWMEAMGHGVAGMRSQRGWLVTAMRRRAGTLRRKLRPRVGIPEEAASRLHASEGGLPPAVAERMEAEHLIGDALGKLAEPYRTVIYLRYRQGWTPTRIATETETPLKTVKTRLSRGLAQLRRALDAQVQGDDEGHPRALWITLLAPLTQRTSPPCSPTRTRPDVGDGHCDEEDLPWNRGPCDRRSGWMVHFASS